MHCYNQRRASNNIDLTGWPYVFTLVLVVAFTWLPVQGVLNAYPFTENEAMAQLLTVVVSSALAFVLVVFLLRCREGTLIHHLFLSPVRDHFYSKCVTWEKEAVFITLKSDKAYIGILWKYPESPRSQHASQTISIIPLISGYRRANQTIAWNTPYPTQKNKSDFTAMETLVPISEITTFRKFHDQTFQHFYSHSIERDIPNN